MSTPARQTEVVKAIIGCIDDCLREGHAPIGVAGKKGSAVREASRRLGMNPTTVLSTIRAEEAKARAELVSIMAQTGHKNSDVARRYIRAGNLLKNPASKAVKL